MAMITPIDKIPISQHSQNDNIAELNDPLVKEVINDIHNSQPQQPLQQPLQQQQQPQYQQPQYQQQPNMFYQNIETGYINYEIFVKSVICTIIAVIVLIFIPMEKINEFIKTNEYELIIKTFILCCIYYLYNINIK